MDAPKDEPEVAQPDEQQAEELLEEEDGAGAEGAEGGEAAEGADDVNIEALKAQLDEETRKLQELQQVQSDNLEGASAVAAVTSENREEIDARSVFVGNIDYSTTQAEVQQLLHACGVLRRVTLLMDKHTRRPKGAAYVEFADSASVDLACALNDTLFKGRPIKVTRKRTNVPGYGRGRGAHSIRGGGRAVYRGHPARGGFRGRGAWRGAYQTAYFAPY